MAHYTAMEPLLPEEAAGDIEDLAIDLVARANGLAGTLHPVMRDSLGQLVRAMNCYYSNLIEGHNTHPIDIERALSGDYAAEPEKRDLQLEARAHIEVQALIDAGAAPGPVVSDPFIKWVHREFCARLPDSLLKASDPDSGAVVMVEPGAFRRDHVRVGRHIAPAPDDLDAFMARFVEGYTSKHLSRFRKVIAVGAAHHRLLWIHPFADGNGRVARLFAYAWLRELGVGSSLWSVARGLARRNQDYKTALQAADEPRRGDLDGRGNLTSSGLTAFCRFFLEICLDQVVFMEGLFQPAELLNRMELWAQEELRAGRLPKGAWPLLREAVIAGEFPRGRAAAITGYQERQARTVVSQLLDMGLLASPNAKGPLRLAFPAKIVDRWFPRLYPAL